MSSRHVVWFAPVLVALAASAGGVLVLSDRGDNATIAIPAKRPAADAPGSAGWVWADGTPGWKPGSEIEGVDIAGVQPVELQAAQLAAARKGLDAEDVRVIVSIRGSEHGALAILAAPTRHQTPTRTCLAALLEGQAPVRWTCPTESRLLVAATRYDWPSADPLYLVGVARGDVHRVVLAGPGFEPETLYTRGSTWGQFQAARPAPRHARLELYGRDGLLERVPLNVATGQQRVLG